MDDQYSDEDTSYEISKDESSDEYENALHALVHVENEIQRYEDMVYDLWYETVLPFIESCDCNTMQKLDRNSYMKFFNLMADHEIYRELMNAQMVLTRRLR
jgi:hypothetical protein